MTLSRVLLICFLFIALLFSGIFFFQQNYITKAQSNCAIVPANEKGVSTTKVNIKQNGDYVLWARVLTPLATSNSFYVQIDSECPVKMGGTFDPARVNKWSWINYKNGSTSAIATFNLSKDKHTLKVIGDSALGIDKILLLNNGCTPDPDKDGDECLKVTAEVTPTVTQLPQSGELTVTATSPSDSKAVITWNSVTGATKYNVYISEEENNGKFRKKDSTSSTKITFDDLNSHEIAKFYVTAVVGKEETIKSNTVEVEVK